MSEKKVRTVGRKTEGRKPGMENETKDGGFS
jgi:hypothetical protein